LIDGETMRHILCLLAANALMASMPAQAHHGWSEYDSNQVLTLTGKIPSRATSIRTVTSS
jgi:hypothetical protein